MELSILLAEQIMAMFLTMVVGYIIVKIGLFKTKDSKIISNIVVYIFSPCAIFNSFQIELTKDKVYGLLLATVLSVIVHVVMIAVTKLIEKPLNINSIEKASIIYTNSGYLIIPLVSAVLGSEWVFYTSAFIMVQAVLVWTHGVSVVNQEQQRDYKKILLNPNLIAIFLGFVFFATGIRLPVVIGSSVSGFGDMVSTASMLVIGMVIGDVNLLWVFRQKRPYLICLLRLIVFPLIATVSFAFLGHLGLHNDAEYIFMVVLLATAAPSAAMVTQLAQIYNKDAQYASVINVMSVIFCIITMPLITLLYEFLFYI